MKSISLLRAIAVVLTLASATLYGQLPQILNYQGNIAVGTPPVNFNGSGVFRFALVNTDGTTTFWSNDGTSTAGSEPTAGVTLAVSKGLYSVLLGDTGLTNMTVIPATVFGNSDVRLRVWFNDGTANGSQLLSPDQRIAAVGYAMVAGVANGLAAGTTVPASVITGTIPASQIAPEPQGMVLIPAGTFQMGDSLDGLSNAVPVSATISAFYMDVTEVTLSQWQAVYFWAKDNGYSDLPEGSGKGPDHPVHRVSWYDTVKWCNARSQQTGLTPVYYTEDSQTAVYKTGDVDVTNAQVKWTANGYRLPTEAEWEKAARGGLSSQRFPWGNTINQNLANYIGDTEYTYDLGPNGFNSIGSIGGTSPATSPVGSFAANGFGLHDIVGNVYECCWDWYDDLLKALNPSPYVGGIDPKGPVAGSYRVFRGGSWNHGIFGCRVANREAFHPSTRDGTFGFRSARHRLPSVPGVPFVTTGTATVGTAFDTFSIIGDVTSDGGTLVTRRGVVYGLMATPTLGAAAEAPATGSGLGAFASILTGLASETTYYFRAYATSTIGTGYGAESSFTTGSAIPFVTTGTATVGTAFDTFSIIGDVASDGGTPVTRRGVVYGLTATPTLGAVADAPATGSGLGAFASILTGLASDTTYYFRAYATSTKGTGYGAESSFTTGSALTGMVLIPAGAFTLGNTVAADADITGAEPVSTTVSAFYLDETEVTLSQWQAVYFWAKDNGYSDLPAGIGKGSNYPVHTVNWYAAVKWCNARSQQRGLTPVYYTDDAQTTIYKTGEVDVTNAEVKWTANGYRLPTEAEWEKAARGGLSGQRFPWGNTINQNLANYYGVTAGNSYDLGPDGYNAIGSVGGISPATSPVGSFAANGYGLHDMTGNVIEWCWDWYGIPYAGGTDPHGETAGSYRVYRGGSWAWYGIGLRVAIRNASIPSGEFNGFGFRSARGL